MSFNINEQNPFRNGQTQLNESSLNALVELARRGGRSMRYTRFIAQLHSSPFISTDEFEGGASAGALQMHDVVISANGLLGFVVELRDSGAHVWFDRSLQGQPGQSNRYVVVRIFQPFHFGNFVDSIVNEFGVAPTHLKISTVRNTSRLYVRHGNTQIMGNSRTLEFDFIPSSNPRQYTILNMKAYGNYWGTAIAALDLQVSEAQQLGNRIDVFANNNSAAIEYAIEFVIPTQINL